MFQRQILYLQLWYRSHSFIHPFIHLFKSTYPLRDAVLGTSLVSVQVNESSSLKSRNICKLHRGHYLSASNWRQYIYQLSFATMFYTSTFLRLILSTKIIPIVYTFSEQGATYSDIEVKCYKWRMVKIHENKNYIRAGKFSIENQSSEE